MSKSTWQTFSEIFLGTTIANGKLHNVVPANTLHPDPTIQFAYEVIHGLAQNGETINATKLELAGLPRAVVHSMSSQAVDDPDAIYQQLMAVASNGQLAMLYNQDLRQIVADEGLSADEKKAAMTMAINRMDNANPEFISAKEAVQQYKQYTDDIRSGKVKLFQLPTDWGAVSEAAILRPGDIMILTGNTGDGKTQAMLQMALHLAGQGYLVIFVTAETTPLNLGGRIISGITGISGNMMLRKGIGNWAMDTVIDKLNKLPGDIWFYSAYFPTAKNILGAINTAVTQALAQGWSDIHVEVDYLQRIDDDTVEAERLKYANVVSLLKAWGISTQTRVPPGINVTIGSQVNDTQQAFGARMINNFAQVVLHIDKRAEEADKDLIVPSKGTKVEDDKPIYICTEHGSNIPVRIRDYRHVCSYCGQPVEKLYYQKKGQRSAFTKLILKKNNEGEAGVSQKVIFSWFDIFHSFRQTKGG